MFERETAMASRVAELRAQLDQARALLDAIACGLASVIEVRHYDAITPNVPEGYDTVLGFLAKYHPDVLDTFDYSDPCATARDGWKLVHLCRKYRVRPIPVARPPCFAHVTTFESVNAYPLHILQKRWA